MSMLYPTIEVYLNFSVIFRRLDLLTRFKQGSTQAQLEQAMPGVSLEELAITLNAALKENRLTVLANAKDSFYKTVPLDEFEK
jgi:hypothetical protein